MFNVQYDTLSSRTGKQPVYAVVVSASAHDGEEGLTIMVDKVQLLGQDRVAVVKSVLHRLCLLSLQHKANVEAATPKRWEEEHTPYHAKKSRRLCYSPTDADMP